MPRTRERRPSQRVRPALPIEMFSCSRLPTWPTVARHSMRTRRCSPDGSFTSAYSPSFAINCAAGAPHHLPALPGAQLDVVDHRAEGDRAQRQAVTRADVRLGSRHHAIADAQPDRREDVALLAVDVVEERQARRAVRIVLDGG